MTTDRIGAKMGAARTRTSTLPFDPADLQDMRVKPAQFARMIGVSKQAVSVAIKNGKLTLGPDGKINPAKGLREYLDNSDPTRVRVRTFRQAMTETDELRARVHALEAELEHARADLAAEQANGAAREQAARYRAQDDASGRLAHLMDALANRFDEASAAHGAGEWEQWADELVATAFYGIDLDEYRQQYATASDEVMRTTDDDTAGVSSEDARRAMEQSLRAPDVIACCRTTFVPGGPLEPGQTRDKKPSLFPGEKMGLSRCPGCPG